MKCIFVKLLVEDVMNPSDSEAREFVTEIINEAFGKEATKEHPRVKLVLAEVSYSKNLWK